MKTNILNLMSCTALRKSKCRGRYTAKKRRRNWNTLLSAKNAMKGIALLH